MKLYTINATTIRPELTEFGNQTRLEGYPQRVAQILAKHGIDGFTMYQVQGYWKGEPEVSFKIEVAIDDKHWTVDGDVYSVTARVEKICEELRDEYSQDSVMLTLPDNSVKFIERGE